MTSFTSRFKGKTPNVLLALLLTAVGGWAIGAIYTLQWNPEVECFVHAAKVKVDWLNTLKRQFENKVIIMGGSSSTFSVDPQVALETGNVPMGNLALGAGMGTKVLSRFGIAHTQPGDTLLVMLEPNLLAGDLEPTQLGGQFSIAAGTPWWASRDPELFPTHKLPAAQYFAALRPGGYHFFTLLGKVIRRQKLYRYSKSDFLETGQQQTDYRAQLVAPRGDVTLSAEATEWLTGLADYCRRNGIRLLYAIPWAYCPPEELSAFREENTRFLVQMAKIIPVLQDDRLGAYTVAEHFADTAFHLNRQGATLRTKELVNHLLTSNSWNASDLQKILDGLHAPK